MISKKYKIAIVDDESSITEILALILKGHLECDIEIFNDPDKALEKLQKEKFDAISLDYRMPNLSGMDIVKLLRLSNGPNSKTRILLLTGHREEAEKADLNFLDEVIFLDKPIKEEKFVRKMKIILTETGK